MLARHYIKAKPMNKTTSADSDVMITVDIDKLAAMLSCGKATARKIGEDAGAKLVFGRRVLYSVDKVREYIQSLTCSAS